MVELPWRALDVLTENFVANLVCRFNQSTTGVKRRSTGYLPSGSLVAEIVRFLFRVNGLLSRNPIKAVREFKAAIPANSPDRLTMTATN